VLGRVVSFADYGVFIAVEPGIEGLIHISDLSWTRDVKHPSKVVAMGDSIEVAILNIDRKARKLSLGLKQVEANPWDQMEGRYPTGTIINGKIKSITEFGVFVGLDDQIDGLLHVSDVSWTRHIKHPSEVFKKGQDIEAVVLKVDPEKGRISLGYKQLTPDPWKEILTKYKVGSQISGRISRQTDFGFFIELSEGIEGLVHVSETGVETTENLAELFPVGSDVTARVIRLDPDERKIALSMRGVVLEKE
jgi:small subunit ribosomal protein S1